MPLGLGPIAAQPISALAFERDFPVLSAHALSLFVVAPYATVGTWAGHISAGTSVANPLVTPASGSLYRATALGSLNLGTTVPAAALTTVAGDLLVVGVMYETSDTSPTCADNQSGAYTLVLAQTFSSGTKAVAVFVRNALTAAASHVVTVTHTGSVNGAIVVQAVSGMTNVGSAAIRGSGSSSGAGSTTPSAALGATSLTTNMTLGFVASTTSSQTPPTGWTERSDDLYFTSIDLESVTRDSGFAGTTITWGATSGTVWGAVVVELAGVTPVTAPTVGAAIVTGRTSADYTP